MTAHHFAVSDPVSPTIASQRHEIALRVGGWGCGYTSLDSPGLRRAWGYLPQKGEPFDSRLAREIADAWAASGVGLTSTIMSLELEGDDT